jgi:hypothetical protein
LMQSQTLSLGKKICGQCTSEMGHGWGEKIDVDSPYRKCKMLEYQSATSTPGWSLSVPFSSWTVELLYRLKPRLQSLPAE